MKELRDELESILTKVAEQENIQNYELELDETRGLRGDGFVGEFFLTAITNKDTNERLDLAVKKALKDPVKREEIDAHFAYYDEVYFYSEVLKAFNQLQVEKGLQEPFDEVPKFYYGVVEELKEAVVLENLKAAGYTLWESSNPLDDAHIRCIFKTYAKFHALSLALKHLEPENYGKLVGGIEDFIQRAQNKTSLRDLLNPLSREAFNTLYPDKHAEIIKYCEKYKNNCTEEVGKVFEIKSDYSVIIHGDNWIRNMMFKYTSAGSIESMKLIDFQLLSEASPVIDLAYFFFSSAPSSLFDKIDDYLRLYHSTLSKTVQGLGCDPNKCVFTFEQLQKEWQTYGSYGVMLSFLIVKIKLMENAQVQNIVKDKENEEEGSSLLESMLSVNVNTNLWDQQVRDIILHAHKTKLL